MINKYGYRTRQSTTDHDLTGGASGPSPLPSVRSERGVSQKFVWLHIDALGMAILAIGANGSLDHVDRLQSETETRKNGDHMHPMKSSDKDSCSWPKTPRYLEDGHPCLHTRKARAIFC